ncbi:hypothetical protein ACFV4F_17265 [Kitasatospora sp. NPDC059722]|uniref:hypothetical protein n=1 Tax=unclassified Kitasatospora TaxID=2633591 RepID=UPI00368C2F55
MLHEDQPAHPWGTVTPAFWAAPEPAGPPAVTPDFADRFAELTGLLDRTSDTDVLAAVAAKAGVLDQDVTAALGPTDPNVANVRELRGLIARRQGRRTEAARWHLHTAGLHIATGGVGSPRARASAKHALSDWREIPDPAERTAVGHEILPVLAAVAGTDAPPTWEVKAYLTG